jgi:hypothetical protein
MILSKFLVGSEAKESCAPFVPWNAAMWRLISIRELWDVYQDRFPSLLFCICECGDLLIRLHTCEEK